MELKPTAVTAAASGHLPDGVPRFTRHDVDVVCRTNRHARKLRDSFQSAVDDGRVFSRLEIADLLTRSRADAKPTGKPDGKAGVVVAYYAENEKQIFSKEALKEVHKFLKDVDWTAMVLELNELKEKLQAEEKAAEAERQARKALLDEINKVDDRKVVERKSALKKDNGTVEDRKQKRASAQKDTKEKRVRTREASDKDLDEELTSSGRVPLRDIESTKLKLHNRGNSKRD